MKFLRNYRFAYIGISLVLVTFYGCGGGAGGTEVTETDNIATEDQATVITFLQLNDLHAHLTAHTDVDVVEGEKRIVSRGGVARLATLVDSIRMSNPATILMNIGDTYHGGVEAMYTYGNAIVEPVNALGIDVGVPGNWDFAYGPAVTRARYTNEAVVLPVGVSEIKKPAFPNLAANVSYNFPPAKAGENFLSPTWVKTFGDIRVGFVGLTSDIVPRMSNALSVGLDFLQAEEDYIALVDTLSDQLRKEGAQVVVVMSELGIHKDFRLANQIKNNSVDVFFSAHTHELTKEPLISDSGALVVEAGNDTYLGRMDLTVKANAVIDHAWLLLPIDNTIEEHAEVKKLVDEARAPFLLDTVDMSLQGISDSIRLTQPIDTVIAYQPEGLDRRHSLLNRFNQVYSDYLRNYTQASIALTPGFRYDAVIPAENAEYEDPTLVAGNVTIEDAYRFFPVPFTLSTAEVSGERLREVIESNMTAVYSSNVFKQSGGWFDGFSGIDLTVNLAAGDGERIVDLKYSTGADILPSDIVRIAGCSRPFDLESETTLCSYSGFMNVTALLNPETGLAWSGVDFLINGLQQGLIGGSPLMPNVVDINNTPLWPEGDYWQPLQGVK